ncbi:hypothetical protein SRHO_G00081190 [Serrasalmus rhombeus]
MASRTTKGHAVAISSTGPAKANAPSPPRYLGDSDKPAQTPVTVVSPSQIMAFKDELVAALRADFASIFKDEIRVVFESEIYAIKQEMQAAKTEISNFKTDIRKDVAAMENTTEQMERGLSGCSDDVVALQRTVQQLSNQVAALEDKCEDLEGRAHCTLQPPPKQGATPRTIVARLHYFHDCSNILRLARERKRAAVNDLTISVYPDYTAARARAAFNDIRQQLHGIEGLRFGILHPAKLRITYKGVEKNFTSSDVSQKYISQDIIK